MVEGAAEGGRAAHRGQGVDDRKEGVAQGLPRRRRVVAIAVSRPARPATCWAAGGAGRRSGRARRRAAAGDHFGRACRPARPRPGCRCSCPGRRRGCARARRRRRGRAGPRGSGRRRRWWTRKRELQTTSRHPRGPRRGPRASSSAWMSARPGRLGRVVDGGDDAVAAAGQRRDDRPVPPARRTASPRRGRAASPCARRRGRRTRRSVAGEADAGCVAHRAVHAVGADDVARADRLAGRPSSRSRRRRPADGRASSYGAVDGAAERRPAGRQHGLGDVLRQHHGVRVGAWAACRSRRQQRPVAVAQVKRGTLSAAATSSSVTSSGSSTSSVRAWMTAAREVVAPSASLVHQQVVDPGLPQGDGERQAGRAGADDQDVRAGGSIENLLSICQRVLTLLTTVLASVNRALINIRHDGALGKPGEVGPDPCGDPRGRARALCGPGLRARPRCATSRRRRDRSGDGDPLLRQQGRPLRPRRGRSTCRLPDLAAVDRARSSGRRSCGTSSRSGRARGRSRA